MHLTFMRHPEIPQRMASSFASSLVLSSRSLAGFLCHHNYTGQFLLG